ncbi:hypothetical protein LENED_005859 [Lentinula edodes]|uniref:Uncharacterized protein n=1 Tax=Lentinula edodes TaxID=5353 RepID=A0A1Q3EA61_LENED|nr:hypothetical protein LENED_005859 [Lentinula edodes]
MILIRMIKDGELKDGCSLATATTLRGTFRLTSSFKSAASLRPTSTAEADILPMAVTVHRMQGVWDKPFTMIVLTSLMTFHSRRRS